MSSLLLGDPSKSYFKLSLWREAASWVERISAGDLVLFKSETETNSHIDNFHFRLLVHFCTQM